MVRVTSVSTLVIVMVTPGSTALWASTMSPCSVAPMFCARLGTGTNTRMTMSAAMIEFAGRICSLMPGSFIRCLGVSCRAPPADALRLGLNARRLGALMLRQDEATGTGDQGTDGVGHRPRLHGDVAELRLAGRRRVDPDARARARSRRHA